MAEQIFKESDHSEIGIPFRESFLIVHVLKNIEEFQGVLTGNF